VYVLWSKFGFGFASIFIFCCLAFVSDFARKCMKISAGIRLRKVKIKPNLNRSIYLYHFFMMMMMITKQK